MNRFDRYHWLLLLALIFLALFVWVSPYRYDRIEEHPVRINRFTGHADVLSPQGWHRLEPRDPVLAKLRVLFSEYRELNNTDLATALNEKFPAFRARKTKTGATIADILTDQDFLTLSVKDQRDVIEAFFRKNQ